jgi:NADH-quinone oxidoreductase subunit N
MKGLLIISGLGLVAMLAEVFRFRRILLPLVLLGLVASYVFNVFEWKEATSISYFDNMIFFDRTAIAFSGIIIVTAFLWFILANDYFSEESSRVDHFALVLFALVGALMLTSFRNMTTLFLGIEIMSIPMYVLAASRKKDLRSNEAGFKYLLMGAFASAFLLFGIALVYGASGSFDLSVIRDFMAGNATEIPLFFYAGVILIFAAMCFKIAAAPFHFWAPDVYEGSPTLITALMSTVVKTAAFAAFLRLFLMVFGEAGHVWSGALAVIIALSLLIANFSAAMQVSVKRMLAYSSISHAAFMLMVILANNQSNLSIDAIVYYSLAYSIGSIAAFGVLYQVGRGETETYDSFNGLGKRNPGLAFCMTVAMLSLAGIPVAAGFFAKYFVFTVLLGAGYHWLLVLGVITSAVAAYYYLKVIIAMYFKPAEEGKPVVTEKNGVMVIVIATAATILLGIVPGYVAAMFRF